MRTYLAELRKLRTVRTTWVLTGIGWALVVLTSATALFSEALGPAFTGADQDIADAIAQIGGNAIIVLVVALLAMTTEFRHGTIGRTLQITPSRSRVLVAKLAAGVTYALAFFVTGLVIVVLLVGVAGLTRDVALAPGAATVRALWQGPVGLGLNAMLGVAVGALIRSQVVAITVTLVWLFVVENLVAALRPSIGRWLPFQALSSLFIPRDALPAGADAGVTLLDPPVALAAFLGYVAAAAVAAGVLLRTRDV
jgi:ABC-2 type transport system permease protein